MTLPPPGEPFKVDREDMPDRYWFAYWQLHEREERGTAERTLELVLSKKDVREAVALMQDLGYLPCP